MHKFVQLTKLKSPFCTTLYYAVKRTGIKYLAEYLLVKSQCSVQNSLGSGHFSFGNKSSCEAIVHLVQYLVNLSNLSKKVFIKMTEILIKTLLLFSFFFQCYKYKCF